MHRWYGFNRFFPKSHGKPCLDYRRVLSGRVSNNRNGLQGCNASQEYGTSNLF